ncbi:cation:proton antiporter [Actinoplanes sp. N902-109]|uniref:cation:proton antiporter n=1 Tax=Actinoplanes sp. (strain N902-109) TaxID=649831 RepID=UPI00032935EA|nr:cation:proton antiporter [Actinoplanes sp. N902-109]AGL15330.1 Putative Na+/H+ antiporter [Actinoplanes sp. N902-109]
MSLSSQQIAALVAVIAIVVLMCHAIGGLFARYRQPVVVGEILAGLLFGPTVLGLVAPDFQHLLFPRTGPVAAILAGLAQLGMLLLMFVTGSELRLTASPGDRRTIGLVAATGMVVPFAVGLAVVAALDYHDLSGPAGTRTTTILVFAIAVAVTSIPVISRIMLDLGLLGSSFARVVLGVAALEDVGLYVVLAVVLSLASAPATEFGLWELVGVHTTGWTVGYHTTITIVFLGAFLMWGTPVFRFLLYGPARVLSRRNPAAARLVLLLIAVLVCTLLGINPIFGALLTGICARRAEPDRVPVEPGAPGLGQPDSWATIRHFSLAFFIPVYFFTVGLGLDLVHDFDVWFFVWFFLVCCVVKSLSVLAGALLSRQSLRWSLDLSIALNARGGPGIVLATTTLSAGVVNRSFYTAMVLLSVLTSQIAGMWLDRRSAALLGWDRDVAGGRTDARPVAIGEQH